MSQPIIEIANLVKRYEMGDEEVFALQRSWVHRAPESRHS